MPPINGLRGHFLFVILDRAVLLQSSEKFWLLFKLSVVDFAGCEALARSLRYQIALAESIPRYLLLIIILICITSDYFLLQVFARILDHIPHDVASSAPANLLVLERYFQLRLHLNVDALINGLIELRLTLDLSILGVHD